MMAEIRDPRLLSPPWRERNPDGTLGPEYGPGTPATYARHLAQHRDWSFRMKSKESRKNLDLIEWMESGDRADVPVSERRVYEQICAGHSVRYAARTLGLTRDSVRSYLDRLRARIKQNP